MMPKTSSATVAARGANKALSSSWSHLQPCLTGRRLQNREEHRDPWIFGEVHIFSVFYDTHDLYPRPVLHLEYSTG